MHLQHANEPLRLFCGEVISKWPQLRAKEVQNTGGDLAKLAHLIRDAYGYCERRAEKELDLVIKEFSEKMCLAA